MQKAISIVFKQLPRKNAKGGEKVELILFGKKISTSSFDWVDAVETFVFEQEAGAKEFICDFSDDIFNLVLKMKKEAKLNRQDFEELIVKYKEKYTSFANEHLCAVMQAIVDGWGKEKVTEDEWQSINALTQYALWIGDCANKINQEKI